MLEKLKPQLAKIQSRFLNLTTREQVVFVLGVVALAYFALDTFRYTPQKKTISDLENQLKISESTLAAARLSIDVLDQGKYSNAVDQKLLNEREDLRRQEDAMKAVLASVQGKTPQIGALIRNLIQTKHQRVALYAIKTLPPKQLFTAPITDPAQPGSAPVKKTVYRHGVQLELGGSYLDLLAYLNSLESTVAGLFWSDLNFSATGGMGNSLKVTIFILSNQEDPILS